MRKRHVWKLARGASVLPQSDLEDAVEQLLEKAWKNERSDEEQSATHGKYRHEHGNVDE